MGFIMIESKIKQLDILLNHYLELGSAMYGGEEVTQLEHALQCAQLSMAAGDPDALVAASLLHDVGHLLAHLNNKTIQDADDHHEKVAMQHLENLFGAEVTQPILLHVNAKRYLCAVDENYWSDLSQASKDSLEVQGGVFRPHEALEFMALPFAKEAIKLRQYDDLAKTPNQLTPQLLDFKPMLERLIN
jgi:phosphonate degradation associated HDIG domain protein